MAKFLIFLSFLCVSVSAYAQKTPEEHYNLGEAKRKEGKYEEAIKFYDKAISMYAGYGYAYTARGLAKAALGRHEEAISDYTDAISNGDKTYWPYQDRGIAKADLGRHQEAIQDFTRVIAMDPSFAWAYNNRGWSKLCLGRNEESLTDFDKAIELDASVEYFFSNRGWAKSGMRRYDEAISDYTEAIRLNGNYYLGYLRRGLAYYFRGSYGPAAYDFQTAAGLDIKSPWPHHNLGNTYIKQENYTYAIDAFNKALGLDPRLSYSLSNRGYCYFKLGRYRNAIDDWDAAVRFAPTTKFDYTYREEAARLLKENLSTTGTTTESAAKGVSVDTDLPSLKALSSTPKFAVIIGNRDYQNTGKVDYAVNDAQAMKKYLLAMGVREDNIIYQENASKTRMDAIFGNGTAAGLLAKYCRNDPQAAQSEVLVYFSGHGAPDPKSKSPYLIPVDCDPMEMELTAYSLSLLYENLEKLPVKHVTVITDACFSGEGVFHGTSMPSLSPVEIQVQARLTTVNSSSGKEFSHWIPEQKHGVFTYFLLRTLQNPAAADSNKDRQLSWQEIFTALTNPDGGVTHWVLRNKSGQEQHPQMRGEGSAAVCGY